MRYSTKMKRKIWVWPLLTITFGLLAAAISRLPIERIGAPTPPPSLPKEAVVALPATQAPSRQSGEVAIPDTPPQPYRIPSPTIPSTSPKQRANISSSKLPPSPSPLPKLPPAASPMPLSSEDSTYDKEISFLRESAKLRYDTAGKMTDLGAFDKSDYYIKTASRANEMARCLTNQKSLRVPFYQGKATCATAISAP